MSVCQWTRHLANFGQQCHAADFSKNQLKSNRFNCLVVAPKSCYKSSQQLGSTERPTASCFLRAAGGTGCIKSSVQSTGSGKMPMFSGQCSVFTDCSVSRVSFACYLGSIAKWVLFNAMVKSVRVGTDFSGLETPCRALRSVGVPHTLVFASEKHKGLSKLIQLDFKPQHFYQDWTHAPLVMLAYLAFRLLLLFSQFILYIIHRQVKNVTLLAGHSQTR